LEFGTGAWCPRSYNDADNRPRKKFDDTFSRLDAIYESDRRTDGWTDAS